MNPQRLVIIGNAGSGKTHVAERLSRRLALPMLSLDDVFWLDGSYETKRPADDVWNTIARLRDGERWIVEGVYGDLAEAFLDRADVLVWLALPWEACSRAIVGRREDRIRRGVAESEGGFQALMAYAAAYSTRTNDISEHGHRRLFDQFSGEKHRLQTRDAVNEFLGRHGDSAD